MEKYYPNLLTLDDFNGETQQEHNGKWIPARRIAYPTFVERIKLAWMVFTGKADAFKWPEQKGCLINEIKI